MKINTINLSEYKKTHCANSVLKKNIYYYSITMDKFLYQGSERKLSIYRVQKNSNFVVMDKTSLQDKRLSWKAKGLHAYMLSLPNDWKFYDVELEKHAKDGKDALKTALKELKQFGYMKRERRRNEEGKFDWETLVFEQPYTENPLVENPSMENPQLLSIESTKYLNNVVVSPFDFYQQNFGVLNPFMAQSIGEWSDDLNEELVIEAMKIALKQQKNWKYCEGILKDWHKKNILTVQDMLAHQKTFKQKDIYTPKNETESVLAGMWGVDD